MEIAKKRTKEIDETIATLRERTASVEAIIRDLPAQTKFLIVVLDELSSVYIDCFENIRAELRKESDSIVDAAREDPVFLADVPATLGEQVESNNADKLCHDTLLFLELYDLARSIREGG
jgi:hypothetical protein